MPAINRVGKLALPALSAGNLMAGAQVGASGTLPGTPLSVRRFLTPGRRPIKYVISGVTRDSSGAALGNCLLEIFEVINGVVTKEEPKGRLVNTGISDASGNYSIEVYASSGVTFSVDAYKAGSPDLAGTTVNTLVGTQIG